MITTRTNEEWLELYKQQRLSGMTMKDWCIENGIKLPTMADRIARLRKMGVIKEPRPTRGKNAIADRKKDVLEQAQPKKSWIEIRPESATITKPDKNHTESETISVLIGDYIVRVQKGFEPEVLEEVCKVLVDL